MSEKEYFRHVMLYYLRKGKTAAEASRNIKSLYEESRPIAITCQKWLKRFFTDDFSLTDTTISGRPKEIVSEVMGDLIIVNPCAAVREIAEIIKKSV